MDLVRNVPIDANDTTRTAVRPELHLGVGLNMAHFAAGQHDAVGSYRLITDAARITLCRVCQRQVVRMNAGAPEIL